MKIAGVREALEASKFALIQMIINPLIGRPQYWWHHQIDETQFTLYTKCLLSFFYS